MVSKLLYAHLNTAMRGFCADVGFERALYSSVVSL